MKPSKKLQRRRRVEKFFKEYSKFCKEFGDLLQNELLGDILRHSEGSRIANKHGITADLTFINLY